MISHRLMSWLCVKTGGLRRDGTRLGSGGRRSVATDRQVSRWPKNRDSLDHLLVVLPKVILVAGQEVLRPRVDRGEQDRNVLCGKRNSRRQTPRAGLIDDLQWLDEPIQACPLLCADNVSVGLNEAYADVRSCVSGKLQSTSNWLSARQAAETRMFASRNTRSLTRPSVGRAGSYRDRARAFLPHGGQLRSLPHRSRSRAGTGRVVEVCTVRQPVTKNARLGAWLA